MKLKWEKSRRKWSLERRERIGEGGKDEQKGMKIWRQYEDGMEKK